MHENWLTFCKDFPFRFSKAQVSIYNRGKKKSWCSCFRHSFLTSFVPGKSHFSQPFCWYFWGQKRFLFLSQLSGESFHPDWCTSGFIDLCHKNSFGPAVSGWKVSLTITGLLTQTTKLGIESRSSQNKMSIRPIKKVNPTTKLSTPVTTVMSMQCLVQRRSRALRLTFSSDWDCRIRRE